MQFTLLPSAVARAGNVEVWRMDPCPGAATAEATRRTNCDVLSLHIAVNKLAGWVCGTNWGTLQFVSEVHRQQAQAQKLSKHVYMPQLTGICNKGYIIFAFFISKYSRISEPEASCCLRHFTVTSDL